jgi:hypothetical protein
MKTNDAEYATEPEQIGTGYVAIAGEGMMVELI